MSQSLNSNLEKVKVDDIFQHWKGGYYRVESISYHHETGEAFVNYYKCRDKNGVFQSIRKVVNQEVVIIKQPFSRSLKEFTEYIYWCDELIPRFTKIQNKN